MRGEVGFFGCSRPSASNSVSYFLISWSIGVTVLTRVSIPLTISGTCCCKARRAVSCSATRASTAAKSKSRDVDSL